MQIFKIPPSKPEIIDTIKYNLETIEQEFQMLLETKMFGFQQAVDWLFWTCVEILKVWGDITGLGYNLINILIFILLQTSSHSLFFTLWLSEEQKEEVTMVDHSTWIVFAHLVLFNPNGNGNENELTQWRQMSSIAKANVTNS